jgi:hypothetical protein
MRLGHLVRSGWPICLTSSLELRRLGNAKKLGLKIVGVIKLLRHPRSFGATSNGPGGLSLTCANTV